MTLGTEGKASDTGYRDVPDLFERIASITRGGQPFNRPTGVAISSSGEIYISDGYGNARVHKFSASGNHLFSWGEPGPAPGQFRLPHSICIDKEDQIWIADRENSRVQIFNSKGEFLAQWTDLIRPMDVCIDKDDIVYVPELCHRISIFTRKGELLTRWGNEKGTANDWLFMAPHSAAVDSRGDLYVGDVAMGYSQKDRGGDKTIHKFARKATRG